MTVRSAPLVATSGQAKTFQFARKKNTDSAERTGRDSGRMMFHYTRQYPQPSTIAASSSSFGMPS
ncbi:hypothetical protein [Streptomyces sp. NBC_01446]|uniref:hypothetical protein n=1 Tax=Streptomyces sp. NBC_01446 TaxID=2903870 RepID=UPI00224CA242|nr:hypothetical protein [Streptomyces sp. NBC_01446]MCX4648683.1 hypothetical protein [Streptomyces sp. NBC_01446]